MSKINILVIPSDAHGVGKFRATGPYTHLQEYYGDDFHIDIKFQVENINEAFEKYDIIVAHSHIHVNVPHDENIRRIEWLKREGKIVIIDTDDFWLPQSSHPMHLNIIKNKIHLQKIALLKSASYVTTTTPIYRKTIMDKLGLKNVFAFPNGIDEEEHQFIPTPTQSNRIRFGWLGGSSHLSDVKLLTSGMSYLIDNVKDKTQSVLCGFDLRGNINEIDKATGKVTTRPIKPEETVWYQYEKIFTKNYTSLDPNYIKWLLDFKDIPYSDFDRPYIRRWTREISKYAFNYNFFDVSLAPLVDNTFNGNKSQLKIIEAGFHKKAVIASNCNPYTIDLVNFDGKNNGNALLVEPHKNHKQWAQHMKLLVYNPNLIKDLGERLHETVISKYSLRVINKERSEFLKSLINK